MKLELGLILCAAVVVQMATGNRFQACDLLCGEFIDGLSPRYGYGGYGDGYGGYGGGYGGYGGGYGGYGGGYGVEEPNWKKWGYKSQEEYEERLAHVKAVLGVDDNDGYSGCCPCGWAKCCGSKCHG